MSSSNPCAAAIAQAVAAVTGMPVADIKVETPPRPELGDFAITLIAIARKLGQPPPQVAARVAGELLAGGQVTAATAAGPFVNLRVDRGAAFRWIVDASQAGGL